MGFRFLALLNKFKDELKQRNTGVIKIQYHVTSQQGELKLSRT